MLVATMPMAPARDRDWVPEVASLQGHMARGSTPAAPRGQGSPKPRGGAGTVGTGCSAAELLVPKTAHISTHTPMHKPAHPAPPPPRTLMHTLTNPPGMLEARV